MLLRSIGAALLTVGAAHGFKNSSPFVMFSTQASKEGLESAVVSTADKVTDGILAAVGDCNQSKYHIMQQPGLTIADLQSDAASSLIARSRDSVYKLRVNIDSVISEVDADEVAREISSKCGATEETGYGAGYGAGRLFTGEGKEITFSKLHPLPEAEEERQKAIRHLHSNLAHEAADDHMVIIISTPLGTVEHTDRIYEMDEPYPSALHQGLRRDIKYEPLKSSGNHTMQDGLPLFEKYQFLSPGLFMALTVSLLLVIILWVGVSAIAGLEVSYMAFSKEMGPAAQNKGKQQ